MTEEVDPRLVALGLVPAPTAPQEAGQGWETAAPPKPTDWVIPTAPGVAPPPPPPPSPTPSVHMPAHKPLTVGDLFPGMGKFTGSAADAPAAPPAPPATPTFTPPPQSFAPAAPPAPKPRFVLPPSGVLLRGPIVMGYPEQKLQITLEQLGFRINAKEPIDVAWTDVREIKSRRGRVVVRTRGRPVAFGIPVEGVAEPTLAGPLSRVVKEASGGSLDLAGSSFLELQNATDSLRDHFHDEDDPLVPTVVGLVFGLAGLTFTAILPDALAIATRGAIAPGTYLLDYPLAGFDPRVLVAAFAAGAMLAAGVGPVALGKAAAGGAP